MRPLNLLIETGSPCSAYECGQNAPLAGDQNFTSGSLLTSYLSRKNRGHFRWDWSIHFPIQGEHPIRRIDVLRSEDSKENLGMYVLHRPP